MLVFYLVNLKFREKFILGCTIAKFNISQITKFGFVMERILEFVSIKILWGCKVISVENVRYRFAFLVFKSSRIMR